MAATTKTEDLAERYRKVTFDTDPSVYVVDDTLLLEFMQDGVAQYSKHRPIYTSSTITVVDKVIDYVVDVEARRVTSVWDLTDGADVGYPIDFEVVDIDGKKIRLVNALPEAGRVYTYYFTKNHVKPTSIDPQDAVVLSTIDDQDADRVLHWMEIRWAKMQVRRILARSAEKGGKWKAGARSESYDQSLKEARDLVKEMMAEWDAEMKKPFSLYGAGYPMEEHANARPTLTGAGKFQGTLGWSGQDEGQRRRGV